MRRDLPRDLRGTFLLELYTIGGLVDALVVEELEAADVPSALFAFLAWVRLLQPITPSGLSAETGMPPTTVRDYVRRLVERGDVRKAPNPDDGRSYHLVLTPQGRRLMDRGWPPVLAAYARVASGLERDGRTYLRIARELRAALVSARASGIPVL